MDSRKFFAVVALAVAALGQSAFAAPIVALDYDTVALTQGTQVAGPTTNPFDTVGGGSAGSLTNRVFFNEQLEVYTYVHEVTPANSQDFSEFNTAFAPLDFNGVAGYSFTQAAAVGVVFSITQSDSNGTIDWEATSESDWDSGETVTFFYQSTAPPREGGLYNIIDGIVGTGESFQPIPAPAALYGGMLLMGMVIATARSRRR